MDEGSEVSPGILTETPQTFEPTPEVAEVVSKPVESVKAGKVVNRKIVFLALGLGMFLLVGGLGYFLLGNKKSQTLPAPIAERPVKVSPETTPVKPTLAKMVFGPVSFQYDDSLFMLQEGTTNITVGNKDIPELTISSNNGDQAITLQIVDLSSLQEKEASLSRIVLFDNTVEGTSKMRNVSILEKPRSFTRRFFGEGGPDENGCLYEGGIDTDYTYLDEVSLGIIVRASNERKICDGKVTEMKSVSDEYIEVILKVIESIEVTPVVSGETDYETFSSSAWGYEIQYPRTWFIDSGQGLSVSNVANALSPEATVVSVFRNSDVNPLTLDEIKAEYGSPEEYRLLGDVTVNGNRGFELEFVDQNQREAVVVGVGEVPTMIFTVFVTYPSKDKETALATYSKMLNSLVITQ